MNVELIPMLLLSLLLMASDGADAGAARLLLSGDHRLDPTDETVIVGDATVTIPGDTTVTAPIYVIGGSTRIDGVVRARVTQIGGTLTVGGDAAIEELRVIGGRRQVAGTADIARRISVDGTAGTSTPLRAAIALAVNAGLLAAAGARLQYTRRRNLDTVVRAVIRHPVVTVTVGLLLTLTALSLFVFMAFTLVLLPVSVLGLIAGVALTALGVVAWGHQLGQYLPVQRPGAATAAGVVAVTLLLRVAGAVPIVGDLVVGFVLLSGLGAVTVTYLGFTDFQPAALPD